ncbi:flagellar biosynthesis protein FlhF [Acetohalobium arabaticum]|uniref:Flagellar biosynthesis protein FlhF n=1 Tax=Acetohalobium arabaticum (strain ATCC 49924 / DSM 5501 / Z-7288) TaxID=574087 RepID=D9QRI8_ACEAZ|nr:flagellar biosynthesis protein FlhF [Acetohalobium arabaticum]ADL13129.1 flagellar biosynthetic protein FlhF [Acetohalobium arabaticum DSM 5501]
MEVKRYRGENMQEAMFKVKADLGSDAIILHTRKFKEGGFLGLFGTEMVEVVATIEDEVHNTKDKEEKQKVESELNQVKQMMGNVLQKLEENKLQSSYTNLPENLKEVVDRLLAQGITDELATEILIAVNDKLGPKEIEDKEIIKSLFSEEIKARLNPVSPITLSDQESKVVAFIGPTGVGKTTTVAKLAADFSLTKNKDVGLVTADTYRIAAVEQLKTYSEIINVPLEVVYNSAELEQALDKFAAKDLVLVDTAGRSQNNEMHMSELDALLAKIDVAEKHLVLSAITKFKDLLDIILSFQQIGLDKFIFTKLDETKDLGMLVNIIDQFDAELSYITNGQNVPEDIEVFKPEKIVNSLLEE